VFDVFSAATREPYLATRELGPPGIFLMIDSLQTGGSERQFAAVSRSLDGERFRVELGCIQAKGIFLDGLTVSAFPLGGSLYGFHSWKTRLQLGRHLRARGISIAHAFDFYSNLTLLPAAKLAGIPVVIGSQRQLGDLLTPLQARAQLLMFHGCDAIVCNSNAAAKRLIEDGIGEKRIRVIRNGLPAEAFAAATPALPKREGWLRVGMIARMNSAAKNHSAFLRAAARVQSGVAQVEFVLIGDGPLRAALQEEAASLGLEDRVQFLGDRRDVSALLASLDVTVLPSASESLSNAILESMAAGVPVVASDVGGNPELLGDRRGILSPVGDDKRLAESLLRLLRDRDLRRQMAQHCRFFAEENFTIERIRTSYEYLYAELLARKGLEIKSLG